MFVRWPVIAFFSFAVAVAILGTDRLGRAFTAEEKRTLAAELRAHDYASARLIAVRFALKLTRRDHEAAHDIVDRVDSRLVRQGWDSAKVELTKHLCRLTWSEWMHAREEREAARRAEDAYVHERAVIDEAAVPSDEERAMHAETRSEAQAEARAVLDGLRAWFEAEGDDVNLLWLGAARTQDELPDPRALAAQTGRDVKEFYAAAKRRKRVVSRIVVGESRTRE